MEEKLKIEVVFEHKFSSQEWNDKINFPPSINTRDAFEEIFHKFLSENNFYKSCSSSLCSKKFLFNSAILNGYISLSSQLHKSKTTLINKISTFKSFNIETSQNDHTLNTMKIIEFFSQKNISLSEGLKFFSTESKSFSFQYALPILPLCFHCINLEKKFAEKFKVSDEQKKFEDDCNIRERIVFDSKKFGDDLRKFKEGLKKVEEEHKRIVEEHKRIVEEHRIVEEQMEIKDDFKDTCANMWCDKNN